MEPLGTSAALASATQAQDAIEKQKKATYCSVMDCHNNSVRNPTLGFFKIPSNSHRAATWLEKLHQVKNKAKKILVCERHFEARYVNRNNEQRTRLMMHAVPTLFLPEAEALTCTPDVADVADVAGVADVGEGVRPTRQGGTTPKDNQRIAVFINKNERFLGNSSRLQKASYCSVMDCHNNSVHNTTLGFFKIPSNSQRAATWLEKLHQVKNKAKKILVCERHFEARYVNRNNEQRTRLVIDAVPTLFLPEAEALTCTPDVADVADVTGVTDVGEGVRPTRQGGTTPKDNQQLAAFINKNERFLGNSSRLVEEIITLHKRFSGRKNGWKYTDEFKFFALNLYCSSPNTYKVMQSLLCLPSISTLYRFYIPSSTTVCENLTIALKIKVDTMTPEQKECAVCIGTLNVKAMLHYNVKKDEVIGFHDVDGTQRLEPAQTALIVMVRGIYHNWKQAISCSFLAEQQDYGDVRKYIFKIINKMFGIGLSVRVLISDVETDFIGLSKECKVNSRSPVFHVNNNKVYYMYDPAHLMKNVREYFTTNNFYFNGKIAKWEHITACYDHECEKPVRLAPQLTSYHIIHTHQQSEKEKVQLAAEVFSKQTAAAVYTYAQLKVIDEPVDGTVDWILLMNKLFNILNFTSYLSHEEASFTGEEAQLKFIEEILTIFKDLRLVDVHRGSDITNHTIIISRLKATLKVIVLLHRDLNIIYNKFPTLLSRDCLDSFFDAVRKAHGRLPTCNQIQCSISNTPIFNTFQCFKNKGTDRLDVFLKEAKEFSKIVMMYERVPAKRVKAGYECTADTDMDTLELPPGSPLQQLAACLLLQGYRRHSDCERAKSYAFANANSITVELTVKSVLVKVTVSAEFVEFIESMEKTLKLYFETDCQRNVHKGLMEHLFSENITFSMPCECFPLDYTKYLFMRYRLNLILNYNNREYENSAEPEVQSRKCFVVKDL